MLLPTHNVKASSEWEQIGKLENHNSNSSVRVKSKNNSPILREYQQLTDIMMVEYLKHMEFLSKFQQSNFHIFFNSISMWQNFFSTSYELNRKLFDH